MSDRANPSIRCTVVQCEHNASDRQHCTLDAITVDTHEANPTQCQCTDCMSFRLK